MGILNAQTVAEAGKTGKKLKAVKPPKELPDEPTDAQIAKYNEQMALYDAYIAQQNEMSLGGLEKIAADFGRAGLRSSSATKRQRWVSTCIEERLISII